MRCGKDSLMVEVFEALLSRVVMREIRSLIE
jgi:hypothetical protein